MQTVPDSWPTTTTSSTPGQATTSTTTPQTAENGQQATTANADSQAVADAEKEAQEMFNEDGEDVTTSHFCGVSIMLASSWETILLVFSQMICEAYTIVACTDTPVPIILPVL